MRLQPGQAQSLEQGLRLSPQLHQSLRLLQAPALELSALLTAELEQNPVLEAELPTTSLEEAGYTDEDFDADDRANSMEQRWLDDLREERILAARNRNTSPEAEERRQHLLDSQTAGETLQQHLLGQLGAVDAAPEVRTALNLLIERLDEDGRLDADLEDIALSQRLPLSPLQAALDILQELDPPGMGARDLRESLLLQARRVIPADPVALSVLRDHFELLGRNRRKELVRLLRVTPARLATAIDWIRQLDPHPARAWRPSHNREVRADAVVRRAAAAAPDSPAPVPRWEVEIPEDHLPKLRLNPWYKDLLTSSDEATRTWLRDKMRDGTFMIRALAQRQQTLQRVVEEILRRQPDLPEAGVAALRPMTMAQVADALEIHETTVSRAVAGKFMQTPAGMFELRRLFTAGLNRSVSENPDSTVGNRSAASGATAGRIERTSSGEPAHATAAESAADADAVSSEAARQTIAELIGHESRQKPLSDATLARLLQERGIGIARRTVAKYREQLGLSPSHLRRE